MTPVIRVDNLSKHYRIGKRSDVARDLRKSLISAAARPFQALFSRNLPNEGTSRDHSLPTTHHSPDGSRRSPLTASQSGEEIWALRGVSFEVHSGEIVGIIGSNGAGKSTLLKILARITEPTTGRAEIKGRIGALLEVGTGFHPELTGRENVYLNGSILGMTKLEINRQFDRIVEFAGVERFIDTPVKRYSSGMHVRLGFAVAAHLSLDILVVDEVLAVGDAAFQKTCLNKMSDVATSGQTVLFVSHSMQAIRQLCTRALWLEDGAIRAAGDTKTVISEYLRSVLPSDNCFLMAFEPDSGKSFQMLKVGLVNNCGESTAAFHCDEPIIVELESESREPISELYGYFAVIDTHSLGTTILVSDSRDIKPNAFDRLSPGRHRHHIIIPARVLAPGEYGISISFASTYHDGFIVDDPGRVSVKFTVSDLLTERGDKRGGYIGTLLAWRPLLGQASPAVGSM